MSFLYTAIPTPSFCSFWYGHPYIPLHFLKMFFILYLLIAPVSLGKWQCISMYACIWSVLTSCLFFTALEKLTRTREGERERERRLQVSRQVQLLTSADACVRHFAERDLKHDLSLSRCKFRASVAVHDVMVMDPDFSRKSLTTTVKGYVRPLMMTGSHLSRP